MTASTPNPHEANPNTNGAELPAWPARTVGVLVTSEADRPHAIPVSAPVRGDDETIWLNLRHGRDSLARLRNNPAVALLILAGGNTAFTARGSARIVEASMQVAPDYAAVAIDVESVDDHRQPAFEVTGSVDREWVDDSERDALAQRVRALQELAAR